SDAILRMKNIVRADVFENAAPVRIFETGEAEGFVKAAVAGNAEVGTEDDADAVTDFADARVRVVRHRARDEQTCRVVGRGRERDCEDRDDDEMSGHWFLGVRRQASGR